MELHFAIVEVEQLELTHLGEVLFQVLHIFQLSDACIKVFEDFGNCGLGWKFENDFQNGELFWELLKDMLAAICSLLSYLLIAELDLSEDHVYNKLN